MKKEAFESWTRAEQESVYSRSRSKRRYNRTMLVLLGAGLILLSLGMVFADVQSVDAPAPPPKSDTLRLTVPKMKRVDDIPVYNAPPGDDSKLHAGAVHLKDTGFPWQREANVYIAGHRLGFPKTGSFLVFWDLNKLQRGDRVVLRDAEGNKYIYKVFGKRVVPPENVSVKEPIEGKNIVTLQTCTLPNYRNRLIVQAELVSA